MVLLLVWVEHLLLLKLSHYFYQMLHKYINWWVILGILFGFLLGLPFLIEEIMILSKNNPV
jgi:hypothetical protein